jgi:hypothetical protein
MNIKRNFRPGWRRVAAPVLLALALTACASFNGDADEAAAKAELIVLQDAWVAAEIAGDAATLARITDPRMLSTFSSGKTIDRDAYIDWIVNAEIAPFSIVAEDIIIDGDTAVVVSRIGDTTKIVWTAIKRDGAWRGLAQTFLKIEPQQ